MKETQDLGLSNTMCPKRMETTIMDNMGFKEGSHWDNGKGNGNYYLGFRVHSR